MDRHSDGVQPPESDKSVGMSISQPNRVRQCDHQSQRQTAIGTEERRISVTTSFFFQDGDEYMYQVCHWVA